jgi:hypothetical protein
MPFFAFANSAPPATQTKPCDRPAGSQAGSVSSAQLSWGVGTRDTHVHSYAYNFLRD